MIVATLAVMLGFRGGVLEAQSPLEPEGEEGEQEDRGEEMEKEQSMDGKSKALAMKIYKNIVKTILPNLQQVLTKKVWIFLDKYS